MALLPALGRQKRWITRVWGQPSLLSELQNIQGYTEKFCIHKRGGGWELLIGLEAVTFCPGSSPQSFLYPALVSYQGISHIGPSPFQQIQFTLITMLTTGIQNHI